MNHRSISTLVGVSLLLAACHGVETQTFTLPDGTRHVDVTVFNKDLIGPNTQVSTSYVCAPVSPNIGAGCHPIGNEQAGGTGLLDLVPAVAVSGGLGVVAASKLRPDTSNTAVTSTGGAATGGAASIKAEGDGERDKHHR